MTYFAFPGFVLAIIVYSEVHSVKKRVAILEAERGATTK
jgi:hypothetical protein